MVNRGEDMILKILVVDDDVMMLDLLGLFLSECGHNLTRATDGDQAARILEIQDFDLVITDLQMGRTSGFDVLRKVQELNAKNHLEKILVVMITGCYDDKYKLEALRRGADYYLLKPFSMHELLECIQLPEMNRISLSASKLQQEQGVHQMSG